MIWLASNTGVLKFTKNKTNFHFEKRFTISDGLPTNHVKTVYVNNESLIVGTNTGVAILPKNQESIPQLIDLYIEKAKYFEKNITPNNYTALVATILDKSNIIFNNSFYYYLRFILSF